MARIVYADGDYEITISPRDTYLVYLRSWENYEMGGNLWVRLGEAPNIETAFRTIDNDCKDSVKSA
jgi:hypothetical protein